MWPQRIKRNCPLGGQFKRKIGLNVSAETVSALKNTPDTFTVETAKKLNLF